MKLTMMEVSGFKLYGESQLFHFGMINEILGDRGKGKTTLCEAVVWCLKGCDLQGSSRGIRKRIKNQEMKEIRVFTQWEFPYADGRIFKHTFARINNGRSTRLLFDDDEVDQSKFDEFFGDTDQFLSIFCPGFLGGISGVRIRNIILSLLPQLNHADVITNLAEEDRIRIKALDTTDPLHCLEQLKSSLDEWNEYVEDLEKRMGAIRIAGLMNGDAEQAQSDGRRLEALRADLLSAQKEEGPVIPDYILEWESESVELGRSYRESVDQWKDLNTKPLPQAKSIQIAKRERKAEMDEIKARCESLLNRGFALRERINSERKQYMEDQADFQARKDYEIQQLRDQILKLEAKQSMRRNSEKQADGLARMQDQLNEGIAERNLVLADIHAVHNFMTEYAEMQVSAANRELNLAEILLVARRDAEGNVTLQHRLLYDKKEYFSLSGPDRIWCSLELSKLVNKTCGRLIPVFADNGEDIESYVDTQTQLFVTSTISQATLSYEVVVA